MFAITEDNWLDIKIIGAGCANSHQIEAVVREALAELMLHAPIETISDPGEAARYQLLGRPGLVINDRVVCAGRAPTVDEVRAWIAMAVQPA